jgi:hypothetical protein
MKRTRVSSTLAILILGFAPFVCGACGLLFTHGPPPGHERLTSFTCTESATGPILDIVWGSLNFIGALAIAGNPDQYNNPDQATASGLVWAAVSAISAGVGFDRVHKCLAAKRQLAERQARAPSAPGGAPRVEGVDIQMVVITPNPDTLTIGGHVQLVASASASSGAVYLNGTFAWSSSNDAIASVSNDGLVTAHAEGKVVIAANTANVVGTASVLVVSAR